MNIFQRRKKNLHLHLWKSLINQMTNRATAVIKQSVRAGQEKDFANWQKQIGKIIAEFDGYQGKEIIQITEADPQEYIIILHFDTENNLNLWENSPERAECIALGEEIIGKPQQFEIITGLEYWFSLPSQAGKKPPPRHKMAVVTWFAIAPLVQFVTPGIGEYLKRFPLPAWVVIWLGSGVLVLLMTYIVMPLMTRLFARWLYRR